ALHRRMQEFIDTHEVYTQDVFACADARFRLRVRVTTELAWHSLFARNLFIRPSADELMNFEPDFTVIALPSFKAEPQRDGTRSETFILVNLGRRIVIIGGTGYAGEIKKSIFTALNYLLPAQNVFPMHCSANAASADSDTALFFGLSGTGSHPHNVMFLSADAYGVLPPVARLDEDQIRHYFLSGYTAKVAGTERGVTEPEPIFSTCFAAPFLVLPPDRYADMLIER